MQGKLDLIISSLETMRAGRATDTGSGETNQVLLRMVASICTQLDAYQSASSCEGGVISQGGLDEQASQIDGLLITCLSMIHANVNTLLGSHSFIARQLFATLDAV